MKDVANILRIARILVGPGGDEFTAKAKGGTQPKGRDRPRADDSPQDVQKEANRESDPSPEEGAVEVEQPDEEETDKDQSGQQPGGKELPRPM